MLYLSCAKKNASKTVGDLKSVAQPAVALILPPKLSVQEVDADICGNCLLSVSNTCGDNQSSTTKFISLVVSPDNISIFADQINKKKPVKGTSI